MTLGISAAISQGWAAPDASRAYTRAYELCQQGGDPQKLDLPLFGLFSFYDNLAELRTARELAEHLLRVAQHTQDPVLLIRAHIAVQWGVPSKPLGS